MPDHRNVPVPPSDAQADGPRVRPAATGRSAAGLFEWDARTDAVRHCPSYPGLLGWGGETPANHGESLLARVRPEDRERLGALRRGLTSAAPTYVAELRVEWPEGRETVLAEHGCGFFDEQGRLARVIGTVLDASGRREAGQDSWEPERSFLRTVIDATPSMIFVKDSDSRFVLANEALARCYGTTVDGVVGKSDADFNADADEVAHFRRDDDEVLRTRQSKRIPEEMVTCADGQTRWFTTVKVPLVDADGTCNRLLGVATDITTLKQAEVGLRERVELQEQLSRIAATVPGVIFSFVQRPDGSACFPYASPAIEAIYGVRAEDLGQDATPVFALMHPDDLCHVQASITESARTLSPWRDEFRVRNPRRGEIWVEGHSVPQPQTDGGTLWTGFLQEVTERKRLEQALRDSERLYRAIGESIDYGVWVCAPDGRNTYASESFLKLVGLTQERCSSFGWGDVLHPDDAERTISAWKECVRSESTWDMEHRFRGVDGAWHDVLARGLPVRNERGEVICWAGINLDISRLKRAEADIARLNRELQRRLSELQTTFDTVPIGLAIAEDPFCRHIRGNPANERLLGVASGGELSKGAPEPPAFRVLRDGRELDVAELPMQRAGRGEVVAGQVIDVVRTDQTSVTLYSSAAPLFDEEGQPRGAVGAFLDITELKRAEQALMEASQRKDEFLAMLAHELRNPLVPIRNAAHIMGLVDLAEPRLRWVRDLIERQVAHLTRLVDDLLDVSRIVRGRIVLKKEEVELAALVGQTLEAAHPLIEARGHRLTVRLPQQSVRLDGDPVRLSQVLLNLLDNAAKYTPTGGQIELEAEVLGAKLEIRVRDNGIGIPAELLPRVFDLFEQGERSADRAEGGLGIGLTLVRRLVEQHGGRVEADSAGRGLGSTFTVRLPTSDASIPAQPANVPVAGPPSAVARVLVVDDDLAVADSTAVWLQLAGHHVRIAYTGQSALELALEFRPQVVLLDISLKGMDGYETARRLRAMPGGDRLCLVAVTGYGPEETRARALEAGFDQHLTKPVPPDALLALIAAVTASASQPG